MPIVYIGKSLKNSVMSEIRTADPQPRWRTEAREAICQTAKMVIEDLEEKVKQAPEIASDEFMYQDRNEAERELEVARKIKQDIPPLLRKEDVQYGSGTRFRISAIAAAMSLMSKNLMSKKLLSHHLMYHHLRKRKRGA